MLSSIDKAVAYGIVGGTPQYVMQLDDKLFIEENISVKQSDKFYRRKDMLRKKAIRRDVGMLIGLCAAVYFCSYVTRINYSAVMVEMISKEGFTRSSASAALTGLFITYGIGQLLSGFCGDRIKPQRLIFWGLLVSAGMNLLIPVCPGTACMTLVWCVNGFAQAMLWPPLVKIMTELLSEEDYKKASVRVSWGSSFGTVFIYLLAPVCITLGGWRLIFFLSAVLAAVMAFLWRTGYGILEVRMGGKAESGHIVSAEETKEPIKFSTLYGILAMIMLAIIMQGILRDGITTWMPSYIAENFNLGNAISVLTSVVLPIFSILSFQLAALLNRKVIKNEILCAAFIFGLGTLSLLALKLLNGEYFILSVASLTMAVGCMHGVNLILICMIPKYFVNTGRTSLISGTLNSCTYLGSAFSANGIALLTDAFGWSVTTLIWCFIALVGTLCCLLCSHRWQRFKAANV